jgi:redox-sensing transcriptional repressor
VNSEKEQARKPSEQVSELTTNRLSVYLRCLNQLEAAGVETISSQALAEQFHLNAAQIRKDLAYFGEFGVRGVGYYVKDLKRHLRQILGLDRLCGGRDGRRQSRARAGRLPGFRREGFEIVALFDVSNEKIGEQSRSGVPIYDIRELRRSSAASGSTSSSSPCRPNRRSSSSMVVAAGVKAILNFSPGT